MQTSVTTLAAATKSTFPNFVSPGQFHFSIFRLGLLSQTVLVLLQVLIGLFDQREPIVAHEATNFKNLLHNVYHCGRKGSIQYLEAFSSCNGSFDVHPCRSNAPGFINCFCRHLLFVRLCDFCWQVREDETFINHYCITWLQFVKKTTALKDRFVRARASPEARHIRDVSIWGTSNKRLVGIVLFVR